MIKAITKGFCDKLRGAAALNTKLGVTSSDAKIYEGEAPQGSSFPYITFGHLTGVRQGTMTDSSRIEDKTFYINCFSLVSPGDLMDIVDLVCAQMDEASLTIVGYDCMSCLREYTGNDQRDIDSRAYQISLRYRVISVKN